MESPGRFPGEPSLKSAKDASSREIACFVLDWMLHWECLVLTFCQQQQGKHCLCQSPRKQLPSKWSSGTVKTEESEMMHVQNFSYCLV